MPPSTPPNLDSLGAWLALLTRSSYLLFVAVLLAWFGRLAWFDRETDGAVSFNYHPLFMGLAFVVLMPEALLAYADLEERRGFGHAAAKKMHAWAHIAASVCILLGLIFVFANHSAKGIPALYSAHSWIGLTAAMCTFSASYRRVRRVRAADTVRRGRGVARAAAAGASIRGRGDARAGRRRVRRGVRREAVVHEVRSGRVG